MKQNFKFAFAALIFASCVNDNLTPTLNNQVLGKWSVESDDLNFSGKITNYVKTGSDYYNFQSNGTLLISEGGKIDSANYTVSADSIRIEFKKTGGLWFALDSGVVVKDSIPNRLNFTFAVTQPAQNEIKFSGSYVYDVNSPVIPSDGSPTFPVSASTTLKR